MDKRSHYSHLKISPKTQFIKGDLKFSLMQSFCIEERGTYKNCSGTGLLNDVGFKTVKKQPLSSSQFIQLHCCFAISMDFPGICHSLYFGMVEL